MTGIVSFVKLRKELVLSYAYVCNRVCKTHSNKF